MARPRRRGGVEGQLVDVVASRLPQCRAQGVGARAQGQATGVGPAQGHGQRLAVEGVGRGPGDLDPHRRAVHREQVAPAVRWDIGGRRGTGGVARDADLGDPDGQGDRRLRVVVQRVLHAHGVERQLYVVSGQGGGQEDGDVDHRARHRGVGQGREGHGGRAAGRRHGHPGGDGVLPVGHHLEVEVVEGDRVGEVVLQPLAGLVGGPEPGLPDRRRVAVQCGDGVGPQVVREAPLGVGNGAGVVGAGPSDQPVDLVVGDERRDPGLPVSEKVRAVGNQNERARTCSTSARGGVPEARRRVMVRVSRSASEAVPAARSRSWGMTTVSSTETPGMPTSAKPVELRKPTGEVGSSTATPDTVIRSVRNVRAGKVTVSPAAVRDAGARGTVTARPPSKVRVTRVM